MEIEIHIHVALPELNGSFFFLRENIEQNLSESGQNLHFGHFWDDLFEHKVTNLGYNSLHYYIKYIIYCCNSAASIKM